MRDSQEDILTR